MCYNTLCSSVNCLVCPTLVWGVESKLTFMMVEGRATKSEIGRNTLSVLQRSFHSADSYDWCLLPWLGCVWQLKSSCIPQHALTHSEGTCPITHSPHTLISAGFPPLGPGVKTENKAAPRSHWSLINNSNAFRFSLPQNSTMFSHLKYIHKVFCQKHILVQFE